MTITSTWLKLFPNGNLYLLNGGGNSEGILKFETSKQTKKLESALQEIKAKGYPFPGTFTIGLPQEEAGIVMMKIPTLDRIIEVAKTSRIAGYDWQERGVAPIGYIKGMAVVYARVYCKLKAGDAAAKEMAKANTGNAEKDALAHYAQEFRNAGMDNSVSGVDTLRHLFVLMIGLGMRESSGRYCEGWDRTVPHPTAETAEAGLFQTSYDARTGNSLLPQLFERYLANPSGFLEIFQEGVTCSQEDWENIVDGKGEEFQRLSKACPAFAAEFAAVGLRNLRKHWGPIIHKEAEIRPEADAMLKQVQAVVDEFELCPALV